MYSHANGYQLQILLAFLLFVTFTSSKDGNRNMKGLLDKILSHGESLYLSSKFREKRSECSKEAWTLDASCSCCKNYCSQKSFSEAYSSTHGNCVVGHVCCLTKQNPIQWTQNCSVSDWPFSVNCSYLGTCNYYCTCEQGYNDTTCAASQTNTHLLTVVFVLVPVLMIGTILIVLTCWYLRYRRHKQETHKHKHNNISTMYMKGNILIIVGNRDELKIYSEQLTAALETLGGSIKRPNVKTISIFQLYIAKYIVKCDKVVFFLDTENKYTDRRVNICMEKIMFRRGRLHSAAVIYFDRTGTSPDQVEETENATDLNHAVRSDKNVKDFGTVEYGIQPNEMCFVSSIKEIEKWLPFVTRIIFNIKHKQTTEHNLFRRKRYFISSLVENTDTSESYLQKLNSILVSCGARKAQSEEHAKCKILVVNNFNELTYRNIHEFKNCYLFSATNYKSNADIYQSMITSMYCREQIMTGIFRVLLQLHIIK